MSTTEPTFDSLIADMEHALRLLEQMLPPTELAALNAETPEQRAAAIAETDRRLGLVEEVAR